MDSGRLGQGALGQEDRVICWVLCPFVSLMSRSALLGVEKILSRKALE